MLQRGYISEGMHASWFFSIYFPVAGVKPFITPIGLRYVEVDYIEFDSSINITYSRFFNTML